jgi:hypothetical protein
MRGTAGRADLVALRAAVYRPGATALDVAAFERAVEELRTEEVPGTTPGAAPGEVPGGSGAAVHRLQAAEEAHEPRPRRPSTRRTAALAAIAVTLTGAVAGAAIVLLARPPDTSASVPTVVHISTTAGDAVFARPQRAADRPGVRLDPSLVPGSLRRLLTAGRIQVYAAQDLRGRRCLVGLQGGTVTSCVAPDRFRRAGLLLLWSSDVPIVDTVGLQELHYRLTLVASWRPDGAVSLGAVRG